MKKIKDLEIFRNIKLSPREFNFINGEISKLVLFCFKYRKPKKKKKKA